MFSYCSFPVQLLKSSDLGRHSLLYLKEIGHGWFGKVKHALLFWKHLITSYDTLSLGFFRDAIFVLFIACCQLHHY